MTALYAKLPYGAQFEVARLVNTGRTRYKNLKMDLFQEFLQKYKTNAKAAPRVRRFLPDSNEFDAAVAPAPQDGAAEGLFSEMVFMQRYLKVFKFLDPYARLFEKEKQSRVSSHNLDSLGTG